MIKKLLLAIFTVFCTLSFGEEIKGWCGTLNALNHYLEGKTLLRPVLSGPEEYIERTSLRVHFTRSGADAVDSIYALRVANYAEYSWSKQIDSLGWAAPPPDYAMGGDDRYDFYITVQPAGVAGMTVSEVNYPDPYPEGASSHIEVDPRLENEFLKVVCAHEFSHASQMRYATEEQGFIFENTAVWAEDVCFENVNDYVGYLASIPNPLANPDYPITSTENLYLYAGGIWMMFLDEYYDRNCPRRVWERLGEVAGRNTLNGIDDVLRNYYGSNLRVALKNYGLWRYLVCTNADTVHYFREGNLWPLPRINRIHTDYPCSGTQAPYPLSYRGGTGYIQFQNGAGKLSFAFDGQNGIAWRCWIVGFKPANIQVAELNLDSVSGTGSDSLDWQDYQNFALIPVVCNWESPGTGITFSYNADLRIVTDVGIQSLVGVPASGDTGDVILPKAWIKNYGVSPAVFPAYFNLGDRYNDMQMVTIPAQDSILQQFSPCTLLTRGNVYYRCTLALNGDERATNNLKTGRIVVWVKDAGVASILNPIGTVEQGEFVQPRARIKNFGNYSALCNVIFWIGNWSTTKQVSLGAGSEIDVLFDSTWWASDTGQYATKCSTAYSADMNRSNDRVEGSCSVVPASIVEDNFTMPATAAEKFEIYNTLGMKIGESRGRLNFPALTSGVYILKISKGEKVINRKILVIH